LIAAQKSGVFLQALAAEADAVARFVELLKLEQSALTKGNTEVLPELAERKGQLAVELSGLAAQRNATLAAQGLGTDRTGIAAWCAKHPGEKKVGKAWTMILALATEARELIRLNGELITIRMQYNSKALEALRGANSSLDLYGPDGQATAPGSRRINDAV